MKKSLLAVLCIALSMPALAGEEIAGLSPGLRELLRKEMVAMEDGMTAMVPAYVRGDFNDIAEIAQMIRDSYIQRQEMTPEQMQELKQKLPQAFTEKDKQFHRFAGLLLESAELRNMESVSYYHSRLLEACVGCHREYALHRFPSLKTQPPVSGESE